MDCVTKVENLEDGSFRHTCVFCGKTAVLTMDRWWTDCNRAPPPGPGTEIEKLFSLLLNRPSCPACKDLRDRMNEWGIDGCKTHRDEIIAQLEAQYKTLSWSETIGAAINGTAAGLASVINPLSPEKSLLDEAIRRASAT
jgi:hypothetical protein